MQQTSSNNSQLVEFSKHDLLEIKAQLSRPGAFTILKFYIDETRNSLEDELNMLDPKEVDSIQRVIAKRLLLRDLLSHFSHYLDNKISETKDE